MATPNEVELSGGEGGGSPHDGYGDRLSSLPDSLICHILSFLPTKFAVATSILSSRWRYIYRDVNSFDFDDPTPSAKNYYFQSIAYNCDFMEFVSSILLLWNKSSVNKFRLRSVIPVKYSLLNSWISVMLSRDVKVLAVRAERYTDRQKLSRQLFTSKTLVVLKLHGQGIIFPELVSLPNLKVLHLETVDTLIGNDRGWVLSAEGYPLLEDLRVVDVKVNCGSTRLDISLPSLRKLAFSKSSGVDLDKIDFELPNLHYLECDRLAARSDQIHEKPIGFATNLRELKIKMFDAKNVEFEMDTFCSMPLC